MGWGLVPEPPGRAGGMLPTALVSLPAATARIGPSGLPLTGQTPSERQLLLLGSYVALTAREQNVRKGISLPFPLPENDFSPTPCKT